MTDPAILSLLLGGLESNGHFPKLLLHLVLLIGISLPATGLLAHLPVARVRILAEVDLDYLLPVPAPLDLDTGDGVLLG